MYSTVQMFRVVVFFFLNTAKTEIVITFLQFKTEFVWNNNNESIIMIINIFSLISKYTPCLQHKCMETNHYVYINYWSPRL